MAIVPIPFTEVYARTFLQPGASKQPNDKWFVDPVRRAHKAGVRLVFGPDVIFTTDEWSRGRLSIDTVDTWVDAGIPAPDILRALTTNAAELLGVETARGSIEVGMKADLIATSANPLDDIRTLKDVRFVMKNGKVIRR